MPWRPALALLLATLACGGGLLPPSERAAQPPRHSREPGDLGSASAGSNDAALERRSLERAVSVDPFDHAAHARLAQLTGRAPRAPAASLHESVELARRHPYDPRALLRAGEWLAEAGREEEAVRALEAAVSLADVDVDAADAALALLPALAPEWRERRIVRTHVFADAFVRGEPGWRFAVRSIWLDLSVALEPVLGVRFVVVALDAFDGAEPGSTLEPVLDALKRGAETEPRSGLLAGLTGLAVPEGAASRRGVADYLGRHLVVRWRPPGGIRRALGHEIVHIFGGVHVAAEVDSLMNVGGDSRRMDALNAEIVRTMAPRGFGPGGIESNVLARIDRARAIRAFEAVLRVNLTYRKLGLDALSTGSQDSRRPDATRLRRVTTLDAHMADVSSFVAKLLWVEGQRVRAVTLFEVASQLYGARTPRGRAAQEMADELRGGMRVELEAD